MSRRPFVAPALALGALLVSYPVAAQAPRLLGEPIESAAAPAQFASSAPAPVTPASSASTAATSAAIKISPERSRGLSGKLRATVVSTMDVLELPFLSDMTSGEQPVLQWVPLFGSVATGILGEPIRSTVTTAPEKAGIWRLQADQAYTAGTGRSTPFDLITRVPFSKKQGTHLNGYHIGRYPAEGSNRDDRYAPPPGFIEVTRENQDFQISEHFRLRQFLTKDQFNVWPKYVALDLRLIDKLELVLQELNAMGVRADAMHVMSGYRTPQYNGPGGNGRAKLSRHTYGDAADVWVDNDGNGYMDDLNGDGRADLHDAAVIMKAVDRVEAKHPELIGGAGIYAENSAHGPFIHIDTRGHRSRW